LANKNFFLSSNQQLSVCLQILAGAYSKSVLTTIERRFNLSSTIVALMSASYQIANMTILVFVSYFGPRYHRWSL